MMVRVFANGLGDLGSIPGRVIPKTQKKCYLIPPRLTLINIRYVSMVKWRNPGKGVVPSPTPHIVISKQGDDSASWQSGPIGVNRKETT